MTIDKDHSTFQKQSSGGKPIAIVRITFYFHETNSLALIRFVSRGIFSFSRNPLNFISAAVNPPFLIGLCPYRQQHRRQPTQQQLWSPTSSSRTYHNDGGQDDIGQNTYHCSISSSARTPAGIELTSYSEKDTNSVQCPVALALAAAAVCCLADRRQGSTLIPKPFTVGAIFRCKPIATCSSGPASLCPEQSPVSSWYQPAEVSVNKGRPAIWASAALGVLPAPRELNPDLGRHIPDAQDPGHRLSPAGEP
ncbi:hypothetical protein HCDG_00439 [Histoplasma capsulatum H143]|uniref:Uncharacterized protein n=1 Tax=Ajellomyces capsulatus (strain H143) TaxID=544712 RepID=C6H5B8_AJECH|nr:hypothetical protein HCDG_00439 [Histoplasma capsulatum H143]